MNSRIDIHTIFKTSCSRHPIDLIDRDPPRRRHRVAVQIHFPEVTGHDSGIDIGAFRTRVGDAIGKEALAKSGSVLTEDVQWFCEGVLERSGVIFSGPGEDRFVYDLRKEFDLFCKLTPMHRMSYLTDVGVVKSELVDSVDILVVTENCSTLIRGSTKCQKMESIWKPGIVSSIRDHSASTSWRRPPRPPQVETGRFPSSPNPGVSQPSVLFGFKWPGMCSPLTASRWRF